MASQAGAVRVHFHDTVNINILPPFQQNVEPGCEEPLPEPFISISHGFSSQNPSSASDNRRATAFHQVFLRSQPRFRGFSQVGVAGFQLALGIVLNFVGGKIYAWHSYIIFWGPTYLIFSGFLAVAAHNIVSAKLVRACNVFHTFSVIIIVTGIVISCIDAFRIFPCVTECGSVGAMAIASFFLMTNLVQLNISGYIVYYGFHSLTYLMDFPSQTQGNENHGFVPSDPPPYSEGTFHELPTFFQPPAYPQDPSIPPPPAYPQDPSIPPPPAYTQDPSIPPPPAYPQDPSIPRPPAYPQDPLIPPPPAYPQDPSIPPPPAYLQDPSIPPPPTYPQDPSIPPPPAYPQDTSITRPPAYPQDPSIPSPPAYP
ncbi:uncharacterized protein [Engystomops pustulosus]|uniref:uncharacterized protein n=1 Tax=Engystomops pustulosus TaxID=76066 RepID=UPI003AFB30E6